MDKDEYQTWMGAVQEHMNSLDRVIEDRVLLKKILENHIEQFFDWDEIEYNRDFTEVILTINTSDPVTIDSEKIKELMMEWSIDPCDYNSFKIIVYPFGVPKEEDEES